MNKETLERYNSRLSKNNIDLSSVLDTINNLPSSEEGGKVNDVLVDGISVVTNGIANISLSNLEKTLQDILEAIQQGGTTSMVIEEIEQIIVSYFENKTVEEVER